MLTHLEVKVVRKEVAERYFRCAHCGARGEVEFEAEGHGGWQRESISQSAHGVAGQAAAEALEADIDRTHLLIPCPTCGRRAPAAMLWTWFWPGACVVAAIVVVILSMSSVAARIEIGLATPLLLGIAIFLGWRARGRMKRAGRARITKLVPGTPGVRPDLTPEERMPRAQARRKAAPKPDPAPLPVVELRAPPPAPPARTADEEPAFLRPRDPE